MVNSENLLWDFPDDDPVGSDSNTGASQSRSSAMGGRRSRKVQHTSHIRDGIPNLPAMEYFKNRQGAFPIDVPQSSKPDKRRGRPDNRLWLPVSKRRDVDPDVARREDQEASNLDGGKITYKPDPLGWKSTADIIQGLRDAIAANKSVEDVVEEPEQTSRFRYWLDHPIGGDESQPI